MARPNRGQHKVPRTYLEAFCNEEGRVWVANDQLKIYSERPHNVLTERDFYTVRFPTGGGSLLIETAYLGGIEGTYASLYREKLIPRQSLSDKDKAVLSVFLASMIERSPRRRASLQNIFDQVGEKVAALQEAAARMTPQERDNLARSPLAMSRDENEDSVPADEFLAMGKDVASLHSAGIPQGVETIAPILYGMKWVFLERSDKTEPFLTSDSPAVIYNPALPPDSFYGPGLAQEEIEVSLPLSPNMTLLAGWKLVQDRTYATCPDEIVHELNRRLMRHSHTLISNDSLILEREVEIAQRASRQLRKRR